MSKRNLIYKTAEILAEEFQDLLKKEFNIDSNYSIHPLLNTFNSKQEWSRVEIHIVNKLSRDKEEELFNKLKDFINKMNLKEFEPYMYYRDALTDSDTQFIFFVTEHDVVRNLGIE